MTLQPSDLDKVSGPSEKLAGAFEDAAWTYLIGSLAKRHKAQPEDLTADQWKQAMLAGAGEVASTIAKAGRQPFDKIKGDLDDAVKTRPIKEQDRAESWLGALAKQGVLKDAPTLADSKKVAGIVSAARAQSQTYVNLAQRSMKGQAANVFRGIVSDAALSIKNGMTPQDALSVAGQTWAKQGVPALVDKAGRSWQPDVYLRMVVQTQVKQTSTDVTLARAVEYGSLVKISSHANSRPTHVQYQDQIYSVDGDTAEYPNLYLATNYGSAGGLCGINCHHYPMLYTPGYGSPSPDNLDPEENNERYALTQQQRKLERQVRAAKRQRVAADQFGNDVDSAAARRLVSTRQSKLREFIASHDDILRRDTSREKSFGLGRSVYAVQKDALTRIDRIIEKSNATINRAGLSPAGPNKFESAITAAKKANKNGGAVDVVKASSVRTGWSQFTGIHDLAGVTIKNDGDIIGVFKHPDLKTRGVVTDLILTAREAGGTKMDCYGKFLVNSYEKAGFKPVARIPFDPNEVDDETLKKTMPDVYVMMRTKDSTATVVDKIAHHTYAKSSESDLAKLPTIKDYGAAMDFRDRKLAEQMNGGD